MRFVTNRLRMILVAIWVLIYGLYSPEKALRTLRDSLDR
jgi:hypothetical protein